MDIVDFLNKNYYLNVPLIEALRDNEATVLNFDDDGLALKHKSGVYQFSLVTDKALLKYDKYIINNPCTVFGAKDLNFISDGFPTKRLVPCHQIVYAHKSPPLIDASLDIRLLDTSFSQDVYNNYKNKPDNIKKIENILENKLLYGLFIEEMLAGFCGRHEDGSMGLLEILPQFKRQGYGKKMEEYVIAKVLKEGKTPYGHVEFNNEISLQLQKRIQGFVFVNETVLWLGQKKNPNYS